MAKKKKPAKRKPVRRRSVGAMALNVKNPLLTFGPMLGGFLMGDTINDKIDTMLPDDKVSQKAKGIGEGGLGAALVFAKLGKKKTPVELIAGGVLLGAGVRRLLKEFGVIQGIGGYHSVPVVAARHRSRLNGYGAVPVIGNGYVTNKGLNGALNGVGGYAVPAPPSSVMAGIGSAGSGSGMVSNGSDCMQ